LTLKEDESLVVALRKLVRRQASGAPVLDTDGLLVGVISQRDIMSWHERAVEALAQQSVPSPDEYLHRLRSERVRAVMTSSPTSIQESASLGVALALFRERGIHRLPVIREGRVVGILTGSNILLAMLAQIDTTHETHRREELQPSAELLASVGAD
jgi:CBS domain-containing protein